MELVAAAAVWLAFCGLAAVIAHSRGRSAGGWFALSAVLSPLFGLIGALGLPPIKSSAVTINPLTTPWHGPTPVKACPHCHGNVHAQSTVCVLCGKPFPKTQAA